MRPLCWQLWPVCKAAANTPWRAPWWQRLRSAAWHLKRPMACVPCQGGAPKGWCRARPGTLAACAGCRSWACPCCLQPQDYSGSGYDRGHLAPNYAIATRLGRAAQEETFLMSNIIPQKHALNAGLWKDLELRAATNYPARFREVWVMAGPVFGANPRRLRGGVAVPESCWMVLLDEHEGRVRTQAFLFPQDAAPDGSLARHLTSIDHIEQATGLDLFPELPDAAEAAIEARIADSVW